MAAIGAAALLGACAGSEGDGARRDAAMDDGADDAGMDAGCSPPLHDPRRCGGKDACGPVPNPETPGCPEQQLVPRCEDEYWNVPALLACDPAAEASACDPRGTWSIEYERIVPEDDPELNSFCARIPSQWRLDVEAVPTGALQVLFGNANKYALVEVSEAHLAQDGCHITLNAKQQAQIGNETLFTTVDLAAKLDGDALSGWAVVSYGSLACGGEAVVDVTGTRSPR